MSLWMTGYSETMLASDNGTNWSAEFYLTILYLGLSKS
jgi:hypothetical protein